MCKVNLVYLYGITSLLHTCTHAILRVENPISPCANINVHMTRHGHKIQPATWNSINDTRLSRGSMLYNPRERLLTQQVSQYSLVGKHVVVNYISYFQLPFILQV